ncbi:unnamed protein product, partial [Hapterophycus canaliculatus]
PTQIAAGAGVSSLHPTLSSPSPQSQPQRPRSPRRASSLTSTSSSSSSSFAAAAALERELLMRYIDLPFHRMDPGGSGFVSTAAGATASAVGAGRGRWGGGGAHGVPGFSAVDEDDSASGVFSDKDFRNMSLKVVTSVVEGRWTVRKAVDEGNSQVLSRKLNQRYFRGSNYMETDVEIGSSVAAESVVGVCLTEPCVLDVGFFLEGGHRILGCVRVRDLKLKVAEPLMLPDAAALPLPPPPPALQESMAAATASQKPPTFGPTPPPPSGIAATSSGGDGAASQAGGLPAAAPPPKKRGETPPVPLGNPQFQATWEDNGDAHGFRVRGPGYLSGGGKVDAGAPFGKLVRADLYKMEAGVDRMDNIGSVGKAAKVVRQLRKQGQFLLIVNLQV